MPPDDHGRPSPVDAFAELVASDRELSSLAGLGRGMPDRADAGLTPVVLATILTWWLALGPGGVVLATAICAAALAATAWALADVRRTGQGRAGRDGSGTAGAAGLPATRQSRRRVVDRARLGLACAVLLAACHAVLVGPGLGTEHDGGRQPVTALATEGGTEAMRTPVEQALGDPAGRGSRWSEAARSGSALGGHVTVTDTARAGWFPVTVDGEAACVRITPGAKKLAPACPDTAGLSAATH